MSFGKMGARGGFGSAGLLGRVGVSYDPAAQAVFASFTTPPTSARKLLINNLIVALKACGAWALTDVLYVMAAADSQAARINWKNPGTLTASAVSSPTFTADHGYTGDGATSYLDTGYDPSAASVGMTINDAHLGVFTLTDSISTGNDIGSVNSRSRIMNRSGGAGVNTGRVSTGTNLAYSGTSPAAPRHTMMIRRDASAQFIFVQGVQNTTNGDASVGVCNNILIGASGAPSTFSDRQEAIAHAGKALSDPQALGAYQAFASYVAQVALSMALLVGASALMLGNEILVLGA